jgi:hypothetical protein
MKDSDFVRSYIEATPISIDQTIRVESVMDIISIVKGKYSDDDKSLMMLSEIKTEILRAVDPKYVHDGDRS